MTSLGIVIAFVSSMIRESQVVSIYDRQVVNAFSAVGIVIGGLMTLTGRSERRELLRSGKRTLYMVAVIVAIILAEVNAVRAGLSTVPNAFKAAGYVVLLPVCYVLLSNGMYVQRDRPWLAVGGVITLTSFLGIVGAFGVISLGAVTNEPLPFARLYSSQSIFNDSNYFAVTCTLGMCIAWYGRRLARRRRARILWTISWAINVVGLFVSWSRTGYVIMAIMSLLWIASSRTSLELKILAAFGVLVIQATGLVVLLGSELGREFLQIDYGMSGRELLWRLAIDLIKERPWSGWGLENIGSLFHEDTRWFSSHNSVLDFFVMTGVPGGASLIAMILAGFWSVARHRSSAQKQFLLMTLLSLSLFAQFITFLPGSTGVGGVAWSTVLGECTLLAPRSGERMQGRSGKIVL